MPALDIIALAAFAVAAVAALRLPTGPSSIIAPTTRLIVFAAMAIYVAIAFGELLSDETIVGDIRIYIHYVEVLFIPLLLYAGHALQVTLNLQEERRQSAAISAQHAMLMRIVDITPAGIAVLDDTGRITFANERAVELLSLERDPVTGMYVCPDCDLVQPSRPSPQRTRGFFYHLIGKSVQQILHILRWSDGRTQVLAVSAQAVENDGAVIAFDRAGSYTKTSSP